MTIIMVSLNKHNIQETFKYITQYIVTIFRKNIGNYQQYVEQGFRKQRSLRDQQFFLDKF